ncbi:MAG: flagellar filament capping protein FliD [Bdellovibrionota bacterium]|nr:flagellar filament capping protein FliD [Bdellovibrionota bacterium]
MGIAFGSINSGLPKDIVKQIIEAEKIPLQKMEARKGKIENKKALLNDLIDRVKKLEGAVYANKGARSFREFNVNISGEGIKASVDKNVAEPGTYQIEVLQLAQKSSAISNGVADKDNTYTGVGYIQYELPDGTSKEIYIDEDHASLTGIAKLINKDADNGMRANVVDSGDGSDTPWKLIITLEETGDLAKAQFPNLYLVDGEVDIWFDGEREAQDSKIKLDGFEIELPGNKTTELIPGVTIDLKKAAKGDEITLEITEDTAKMADKIDDLVANINQVIGFIKEQNRLDESSDTSQTLGGDITLQTLESRLRSSVFAGVPTEFGNFRIGDLGLQFQKDGMLKLDKEKFQAKLDENIDLVNQVINGRYSIEEGKVDGFVDNIERLVKDAMKIPGGILSSRKSGLDSKIAQIDRRIDSTERRIKRKEENLKAKFARLEETISRIKTQGSGLAGLGGGGFNPVQQLG